MSGYIYGSQVIVASQAVKQELIVQSWQLSEDFSMVMDMPMLMYLVLA